MNTTFTNCAEKKAKQILNLLQGYTKGMRITAMLMLLVVGTSNAWGAYEYGKHNLYLDISKNTGWKVDDGKVGFHFSYNENSNNEYIGRYEAVQVDGNIYCVSAESHNNEYIRGIKACRWKDNNNDWNTSNSTHPTSASSYSSKNCLQIPSNGWNNCTLSWTLYVPTVSSVKLTHNASVNGGSGTEDDPYMIPMGTSITVTATPTSVIYDNQCTLKYKWDDGAYDTSAEKTLNCSSANTLYSTSVVVANEINSTKGKTADAKIYFKTELALTDQELHILGTPSTIFSTEWSAHENNKLIKANSTATSGSLTIGVNTLPANNDSYQFKVYNATTSTWYGWSSKDYYWMNDTKTTSVFSDNNNQHNLYFIPDALGDYVFDVDWSGTNPSLKVTFPTSYTVTFGKGTGGSSVTAKYDDVSFNSGTKVQSGKTITFTQSASTGYKFKEWNTKSDGSGTCLSTDETYTHTITTTNTVYAIYTENTFAVTINAGDNGSVTPSGKQSVGIVGIEVKATANDGYRFVNWTADDGITLADANSATTTVTATAAGTVTANFELIPCQLLHGNETPLNDPTDGGSMTFDLGLNIYYIDVTTNSSPYYFRFKYNDNEQWSGTWNGNHPYVFEVVANGDKVDCNHNVKDWTNKGSLTFTGMNGSDIRIWFDYNNKNAWITEDKYTIAVSSDANGSASPSSVEASKNIASAEITANPNNGYEFDNWTVVSGDVTIGNQDNTTTTVTATSNGEIQANFTPITYSITYILDGGTGVENGTYTIESEAITLPTPTKENFNFGGWYEENTFNSEAVTTIPKVSTGHKTFYAKWGKNFNSPRIYFNNTDTQWETAMLLVGRAHYSTGYNQHTNPVRNTQLVYFHPEVTWTDQTRFTVGKNTRFPVGNAEDWGESTESWETRVGSFAGNVIGTLSDYNFESDKTYYITGSVPNTINVVANKYDGATDYPSLPFYTAEQAAKVRDTKDDNYAVVVGEWPASLSLEGTNMGSNGGWNGTERHTITGGASTDGEVNREYTAVVTGLITHTYSDNLLSTDYQFDGWGTANEPTTTDASYEYNIANNTTVYAFFTKIYSLTLGNVQNGSIAAKLGETDLTSGTKVAGGSNITLTATPDNGYHFVGWTVTKNSGGTITVTDNKFTMPAEAVTVTATFAPNQYTVTFDNNGADAETPGIPSTSVTYGEEMPSIAEQLPKKTGYYFGGYFTETDGQGTQYYNQEGTAFSNKTWDKTSDTQLYIKWIANKYTVIFKANGGTGTMENQKFTYDVAQKLTANTFTRTGYTFAGWNTNPTGTGNSYSDAQEVINLNSTKNGQETLHAQWGEVAITSPTTDETKYLNTEYHSFDLGISFTKLPDTYKYRVYANNGTENSELVSVQNVSAESVTHTIEFPSDLGTYSVYVEVLNAEGETVMGTSETLTVVVEQAYEVNVLVYTANVKDPTGGKVDESTIYPSEHISEFVEATPNPGYMFQQWYKLIGNITIDYNKNSEINVTATENGSIYVNFVKRPPQTIYLKTAEETADGTQWFVKYGNDEFKMEELGCTDEFYSLTVPDETDFTFIAKDAEGNPLTTSETLRVPLNGNNMFDMTAVAAAGMIYLKPNSHWLTKQNGKTPRFAAHFYNPNEEWIDLVDTNSDGIYECEKPAGGYTQIQFYRMKENTAENNWNNKDAQTAEGYATIDGNLFTIDDDQAVGGENDSGVWSTYGSANGGSGVWTVFSGVNYVITLDQQGATTAGTTSIDITIGTDMPEIELPTMTDKKFAGYYTEADGQGNMIINARGEWQEVHEYVLYGEWAKEDCATFYAFWKDPTAEITDITLDPNQEIFEQVAAGETGDNAYVKATPTITKPDGWNIQTKICWKLLYSDGSEVVGHEATKVEGSQDKQVKFLIAGLASGTYTIEATLRTGTGCESGEELSVCTKTIIIASDRTVTVRYMYDDTNIQSPITVPAHATITEEITAPDIIGYTFSKWVAGDGVTITSTSNNGKTITYTAIYDGYLTATYERDNNIIYFYNTLGWSSVYVYYYSEFEKDGYWNEEKGTGTQPKTNSNDWYGGSYKGYAQMTQIEGTNIWYVNASGKSTKYLVFGKDKQLEYDFFYSTSVCRRGDYDNRLPMFVPIASQTPTELNPHNDNVTKYYNKGYWMNYPENTGYTLKVYNQIEGDGTTEVASIPFPFSADKKMPLSVAVDLEAGKTYGFKILREDNSWYGNNATMNYENSGTTGQTVWEFKTEYQKNCGLTTNVAGYYTFTLTYGVDAKANYNYLVGVDYPVAVGDYRVVYQDDATWSHGTKHGVDWYHPSYAIKKNKSTTDAKADTVSFFISKGEGITASMKFQKCTEVTISNVTWEDVDGGITIPDTITEAGVYNFIVEQPANGESISLTKAEPYTGNYYIRTDPIGNGWNNYKNNPENRMTYSAFSESDANMFGEKYSHYATQYCDENTNVKFVIANDYSPCISDTIAQDKDTNGDAIERYTNEHGNLGLTGNCSANIRFMWNRKTNKISRAYLGAAGATVSDRQFLILKADKEIKDSDGGYLSNAGDNHSAHQAIFQDTQNWIYERTIQVLPKTRVKLYACYPDTDVKNAQFFYGSYDNNNYFSNATTNSIQILGGEGNTLHTMRVIYDFKTNRLMTAWMPSGTIDGEVAISADVMIMREHQEDAQCITLADAGSMLTDVKTVYGTMRFNRWTLNNRGGADLIDIKYTADDANNYSEEITNRYHPVLDVKYQKSQYERALYFISFPFDVHLSDVFGFGTYGQHWVIEYYDGLKRAREGYWIDSDPNWKYVTPNMADTFKLRAYQGYILCLNLSKMAYNNTDFWAHNISQVELFFPSTATMGQISQTEVTMPALGDEYLCKINRGDGTEGDRRVKDSYWRCIGVPSYANYSNVLKDSLQQPIQWQTNYKTFPFLYAWNMTDNTLTPQSTNEFNFKTMHAYLVQNGGKIHWSAVSATPEPSNIVARRQAPSEVKNYEWKIAISRNDKLEDQTFIRMTDHEQVTTDFDFNQDMSKEFNYGRSDIYTLIGYEKAAANSLPFSDQTTIVPLGLSIEYNGEYTIAMPAGMENIELILIDTESNTRTNLSAGMEYTLTLNKGDYNNRFFIEIAPIHNTPTDIEYTTEEVREQKTRKVLIDNILYLIRDGEMYDARGVKVK